MSVPHTLKLLDDVKVLAVDLESMVTAGPLGVFKVFSVISDVKDVLFDAPPVLPELENLTAEDSAAIGSKSYEIFKALITAVKA